MSKAWNHFQRLEGEVATCKICFCAISTKGGSTKGLLTHLRTRHDIEVINVSEAKIKHSSEAAAKPHTAPLGSSQASGVLSSSLAAAQLPSAPAPALLVAAGSVVDAHGQVAGVGQLEPVARKELQQIKRPKLMVMTDFFPSGKDSSATVISRLVAKDGLSFNVIAKSEDLRAALGAKGIRVAASPTTIALQVMDFARSVEQKIRDDLLRRRNNGDRFALCLDEWTALNNKRYLNINVHLPDHTVYNLGLTRVAGSLNADRLEELVAQRLHDFGLTFADVIACTTDGAAIMKKFGRHVLCEHQQCYAHGVHLAVCDVLYKLKASSHVQPDECEDGSGDGDDEDDDDEDDGETVLWNVAQSATSGYTVNVAEITQMVRRVVKLFRKSPVRNDMLQQFVKEDVGKEMTLLLDTKTRWNSLLSMMDRFVLLHKSVQKALVCLELNVPFTQQTVEQARDVANALKPLELTVRTLSRRDCQLSMADAAVGFAIAELNAMGTDLSQQLSIALESRISERRGSITIALNVLSRDGQTDSIAEFNAAKYLLIALADKLQLQIESEPTATGNQAASLQTDPNVASAMTSMEDRLKMALEGSHEASQGRVATLEGTIGREMEFLRATGQRGKLLRLLYNALLAIPATSVEAERAFSAAGGFLTKVRSRLSDNTLSKLALLRAYFTSDRC